MRKDKIIESVRGYLLKREAISDDLRNIHPARLEVAISQYFSDVIFNIPMDSYELDDYTKTFHNQAIKRSNGVDYIALPSQVLNMPKGRGVRFVTPPGNETSFVPCNLRLNNMTRGLPVGAVMNKTTFRLGQINGVDGNVIVLEHFGDRFKTVEKVDVGVIRPFEAYAMDEDIYMPKGSDLEMLKSVLQIIGVRYIDDVNNNK